MENDVNLDYGLQLINNHNMAEDDEEDEESAIENFVDSPRQMDRQNSQELSARSGNSTPLVTIPDMVHSNLISNNWPLQLGSYNREKKLIRDVSNMQLNRHLSN